MNQQLVELEPRLVDPREWDDPDTFDVRRDASRQIGFGYGAHGCAGQGLAPVNNIIHRFERLPLELVPA